MAPAVHGEMVPGGGGFHLPLLHEAQEQKPRYGCSGAATCWLWAELDKDSHQLQVRLFILTDSLYTSEWNLNWAMFDPSVGTARASRWPRTTVWPMCQAGFSTMFQVCFCLLCFILLHDKTEKLLFTGFGSDVDSFVVRTNYKEYAVMLQLSTEKLSGDKSTNIILYSEFQLIIITTSP